MILKTIHKDASLDTCPECKTAGALRRSRARNFRENIIKRSKIFNIYRCRECGWRGVKTSFSFRKISLKVILFDILLILISALIIRYIIIRFVMN